MIILGYYKIIKMNEYTLSCFRENCRLGLCCINNSLRSKKKNEDIFCSRRCIQDNFTVDKAQELALQNVKDIIPLIEWNHDNGIKSFRLSSELFPHYTNPNVEPYDMKFAIPDLQRAGELANFLGHRITTHPDHFVQLGSKRREVVEKSYADLDMHAEFLSLMNVPITGDNGTVMCIHGGGTFGEKENAMRRWIENFDDCSRSVKNMLCIENCEKNYSLRDVLTVSKECKIPVILDYHHYVCYDHYHPNETQEDVEDMLDEVIESWGNRKPLFHISDQKEGAMIGAHHDYVETIPDFMIEIPERYNIGVDIDIEAKAKEAAVLKLNKKYGL